MVDLFGKSPKMWVTEICVKQLVQPRWLVRNAFPGRSPPTFICCCTVSYQDKTLKVEASGKTKKEAEQEAAREMLMRTDMMALTPANLYALSKTGKVSNSSGGGIEGDDDDDVSDTDDRDLALSINENPIGELFGICVQYGFLEPIYEDIKCEGPSHKRIFSVRCTVMTSNSKNISRTGRRMTKKSAKKVAAFRVLRELKKDGCKLSVGSNMSQSPINVDMDVPNGVKDIINERAVNFNNIASHFNHLKMENGSVQSVADQRDNLLKYGSRLYCRDTSGNCLKHFIDYPHAFQHLKKSNTMDRYFGGKNVNVDIAVVAAKYGDPMLLLETIARETGLRVNILNTFNAKKDFVFLSLEFPFTFKFKIPSMVIGKGSTFAIAKTDAVVKALKLLRLHCYDN